MRHRYISLIAAALLTSGCGGVEPQVELTIGFANNALLTDVNGVKLVRVTFHNFPMRDCPALKAGFAARANHSVDISTEVAGSAEISGIRAGSYSVAVFGAASAMGPPIAFGCVPNQTIEDGKKAEIKVDLDEILRRHDETVARRKADERAQAARAASAPPPPARHPDHEGSSR